MAEERRINLRVSPEEYKALDKKRFEEGTTFQEVGLGLFRAWLSGDKKPDPSVEPDPDVEMLRRFKEIGSPEDIKFLRGNILVFLRDAERTRRRKGA